MCECEQLWCRSWKWFPGGHLDEEMMKRTHHRHRKTTKWPSNVLMLTRATISKLIRRQTIPERERERACAKNKHMQFVIYFAIYCCYVLLLMLWRLYACTYSLYARVARSCSTGLVADCALSIIIKVHASQIESNRMRYTDDHTHSTASASAHIAHAYILRGPPKKKRFNKFDRKFWWPEVEWWQRWW